MQRENLTPELLSWIEITSSTSKITSSRMDDHVIVGQFDANMLKILGCKNLELVTSISVIEKMMFEHGISAKKLHDLCQTICTPAKIYKSASHPNNSVVVMTMKTLGAKPILVPVWIEKPGPQGKQPVHWISSGYVKDDPNIFSRWEANGLLIWRP